MFGPPSVDPAMGIAPISSRAVPARSYARHPYCYFLRGLPASERFLRQDPSWLRSRGCFPTWGMPLPALRPSLSSPPFHLPEPIISIN